MNQRTVPMLKFSVARQKFGVLRGTLTSLGTPKVRATGSKQ
jgi:hypothetical protein